MHYGGERTLGAIVAARAEQEPDRAAVRFPGTTVRYGDLHRRANRVANALLDAGLRPGETVAVMLSNSPEYVEAWVGIARAGLVEVPVNTGFKGDLLRHLLEQAQCAALVVDDRWLDRLGPLLPAIDRMRLVLVVGAADPARIDRLDVSPWHEAVDAAAETAPAVAVSTYDVSAILFTSGTTGPSKGAVLTHSANFRLAQNVVELMDYGPDDVCFNAFPLFHVNARYSGVLPAMYADAEIVVRDRFSASGFWATCRAEGVTAFNYMGALLMMLHKQPPRADDAENPVRRAYGAPAPVTIYEDFQRRFGLQLVEVYGSTEAGTALMNTVESFRIGSCGRPVPYFDVRIHDRDDEPCPPGVPGEIVLRPLEPHVLFEEYVGMPETTLAAFRNLWFHTGDRGRMDDDGYFYWVDRMKDAIRRRGENISSWDVENVVNSHSAVEVAAVIGVPSDLSEEEVMVVVVAERDGAVTPEELLDLCQERLPHFAVPRFVRFVEELPRTPSQRIEKFRLREIGVTPDTWDREEHGYVVRR